MQLVDCCALPPGGCIVSGRSEGRLIDTLRELPMVGRVYLHEQVVLDAIDLLGGLRPDEVGPMRAELERLRAEVAELEQELDDYDALRVSVARTLKEGGTLDRRGRYQVRGLSRRQRERIGVDVEE